MFFAEEYKLDIIRNLFVRSPIIIMLLIVLTIVLLAGIYYQSYKTRDLMKINNELLKDIKDTLRDQKD